MSKQAFKFKFKGKGAIPQQDDGYNWQNLNRLNQDQLDQAEDYHTEDLGLVEAVNTALSLGMPLLLTGAPGVGKTQLAYRIAYELGCQTLFFSVKSRSEAQDLFYNVDHLRRLHAAQINKTINEEGSTRQSVEDMKDAVDIRQFIHFQGLGLAILRAMPIQKLQKYKLTDHAWPKSHEAPVQQTSVVLVDEIDKAPMDFCNDMLEEIRRLQFSIPELGDTPLSIYQDPENPKADEKKYRPQIIITSNSEKGLPEPFLRRCIYYHIQQPNPQILKKILQKRLYNQNELGKPLTSELQDESLQFFIFLRDKAGLEKAPSTAELLSWFLILGENATNPYEIEVGGEKWLELASFCLLKKEKDQQQIEHLYEQWQNSNES